MPHIRNSHINPNLGPGGTQQHHPLGPGGTHQHNPLGPGGIQQHHPLGPGGIQQHHYEKTHIVPIHRNFINFLININFFIILCCVITVLIIILILKKYKVFRKIH